MGCEYLHQTTIALCVFHAAPADSSSTSTVQRIVVGIRPAAHPSGRTGVMHGKCVIADRRTLFLTSANLTGTALSVNMEMGFVIHGGHKRHAWVGTSITSSPIQSWQNSLGLLVQVPPGLNMPAEGPICLGKLSLGHACHIVNDRPCNGLASFRFAQHFFEKWWEEFATRFRACCSP